MPLVTAAQFRDLLQASAIEDLVRDYLFDDECYIYRRKPTTLARLRGELSSQLHVDAASIFVVGSAKTGFSLSPNSYFAPFRPASDVDVVVIDDRVFDDIWSCLLEWNYPRRNRLDGPDRKWAKGRMEDLYWGWFSPDRIKFEALGHPHLLKPLRELSTRWFDAFHMLGRDRDFFNRNYSGRLYRTWKHALLYHADGLRRIRDSIAASQEASS